MKKLFLIVALAIVLFSCKKDNEPATVNIEVSYYYNDYQGYKPDIAAILYLCEKVKTDSFCNDSTAALFIRMGSYSDKSGELIDIPYKYKGEAGSSGNINIVGVIPGDYLFLLVSKGRYVYTHRYQTIHSGENVSLVKNFGYLHDWDHGGEIW